MSSGQAQGGYSQTFSDHQTFGFQYRDPPGPAVVGVHIPPQGPGVYGHGNRATIAHRTDATPEDRPMKRKGAPLLEPHLQPSAYSHPHGSALRGQQ